jgi:hypothetical protein
MWLSKDLFRYNADVTCAILDGTELCGIAQNFRSQCRLVREFVESVVCLDGGVPCICKSKDEINPFTEVRGNVRGLEGLPMDVYEKMRAAACPRREADVVEHFPVNDTEVKAVIVQEKVRESEELGQKFAEISGA